MIKTVGCFKIKEYLVISRHRKFLTIGIREFRSQMKEAMSALESNREFFLEKNNRPVAVVMQLARYRDLNKIEKIFREASTVDIMQNFRELMYVEDPDWY